MSTEPLLTEQEFDELDHFLLSDRCGDDAMTMDSLHGLLTAIAIGPESIATAEWLPKVWGSDPDQTPTFQSTAEANHIQNLMERMLEDITVTLDIAPSDFEPLFCEYEWKGKRILDAESWAWGFMEGVSLRASAWQHLRDSPQATLLKPIYLLGAEEIQEEEVKLVDDPIKCHKLAIEIEASVIKISFFWGRKTTRH
jgi:uncharacterized protein